VNLAGIELRYLVNEIGRITGGYYVSNIYGITKNSLLFKLHHPEREDVFMMLSTAGIWTTSRKIDPIEPNRMLKRLRNDLLRAKIVRAEQIEAERIVYLTFSNFEKEFVLVSELFGDGNLILCNSDMKILALLHSIEVRHRKLAVGLRYNPPPSNSLNIFDVRKEHFEEITKSEIESVRWLGRSLGFPKKYAEEIFHRAGIDPKKQTNTVSEEEIERLYSTTRQLVQDIVGGNHKCIIVRREGSSEIYPLEIATQAGAEPVSSFMEGLDRVFTEDIVDAGRTIRSSATDKKIQEYQSQLEEQNKAIETVKQRSGQITAAAKAIMGFGAAGILSIEDRQAIGPLGQVDAELVTLKGVPYIRVLDEKIEINPQSPLQSIASALFNEAKKQSNAVSAIEEQRRRTEKRIAKLQSQPGGGEGVGFQEIAKRTWFQRYRWFFTSDSMMAVGGRDSSSNSAVIRKHLEKNDKVFHAEIFGSPFFILKNSADATSASLSEVAHATVCFSRAWREAMYGMSSYWVSPEQVKKAAPSGQFLPKGSFIVDGQRNFVKIASLRLAVGIVRYNDSFLLTCGPPGPIKKQSVCYAMIEPSSGDMAEAAKRIRLEFTKVHEEIARPISLDEFVRVLPAGGSHITELGEGQNAGVR